MKLVFDIGGSHMRVAPVLSDKVGKPLAADTPHNFAEGMQLLCRLVEQAADGQKVDAIAGGSAGNIVDGRVDGDMPNLPLWDGKDIGGALRAHFSNSLIIIDNDGLVGTLGEARLGAGKGFERVAYVCIGTGIGGGLCVDGTSQPRGEFKVGWQVMDAQGHTLEQLVGGRGAKEHYGKRWEHLDPVQYAEALDILAEGLRGAATHWRPDIIVLGGKIPFVHDDFLSQLVRRLPQHRLALAAFGDQSVLWGALTLLS